MRFEYFSHNGVIKPADEAAVPLANIEYSYGYGVYETVRVHDAAPYFLDQHMDRLLESARIIGIEHTFTRDDIERSVEQLVAHIHERSFNLKILLIGGKTAADADIFILPLMPHYPDKKLYRDGATAVTVEYERNWPHAKTLNMLGSYLAYQKAREAGAYDALLVNTRSEIVEGTRTNFFVMKDRTIISPPEKDILLGVTRAAMMEAAREGGFGLEERTIPLSEVGQFDAAFLTSTSSNIMPLRAIDSTAFNPTYAPLRALMVAFDALVRESKGVLPRISRH